PVTTTPAVAASGNPARPSSRAMSVKISSTRGWMISERTWRESWRGFRPPTDGTSTVSSAGTNAVSAHPYRFFMSSAEGDGVRRPIAMSFEMWSPPSGRTAVCQIAPLRKSATSVVPPPMSTTTTPSSFSSSYRTASPEASGSRMTSCTARPARFTERTRFWTEVTAAVTTCTSTSRRTPDMPMGSRIPSPSSTIKFWGRTWMISRSCGRLVARAASPDHAPYGGAPRAPPLEEDLVPEPEIHRADILVGHLAEHALEAREALLPVLGAQPHLDAVHGVEHRAVRAAHVDLGDLGGERAAGPEEGPDERDGRQRLRARRALHRGELVVGETAHDRNLGNHRLRRGAED